MRPELLSRREVIRNFAIGGAVAACEFATASRAKAAEPATAFALLGDRYHNIDHYRTALGKTLVKDAGISIDFSDEVKQINRENLGRYKLLIVLRDGMVWPGGHGNPHSNAGWWSSKSPEIVSEPPLPEIDPERVGWITAEQGKAVKEFAENGGGVLFYHNVTYISPYNDDFRDVLGAVTRGHPPIRPFRVKITNKEHPITKGVKDFLVTDEQHYVEYQKDAKYLLMESVNEDGLEYREFGTSSPAGWAYDYGKGRVCYLAPGHLIENMWNPEYEKLQKNAARWLLRNE
jgi:type 1 glutamine amidotransferase